MQNKILLDIPVKRTAISRLSQTELNNPPFGVMISDHMFIAEFDNDEWITAGIVPYADISLAPTSLCLHYGQTVFEGMKAFKTINGDISIFRMDKHYERFSRSLERMCMPLIPEELFREAVMKLIETDKNWIPDAEGTSLYIRPFMIATEERFGVKISSQYKFMIFTGPVPLLFLKPLKIKVETHYVRAAKGGVGYAKCGGNYGAAYYPTMMAKNEGYDAVLWTDSHESKFIEESGTMNVFFLINNVLVTPPLSDSILDGITRDSIIRIADHFNTEVIERNISYEELIEAIDNNELQEAFGAGTAAVVAPIQVIGINGTDYKLPSYTADSLMLKIKARLSDIRTGKDEDIFNWNTIINGSINY